MKVFIKVDDNLTAEQKQGVELLNVAFNQLDADTQKSLQTYQKGVSEQADAIMKKSTLLEQQLAEFKTKAEADGKSYGDQITELKDALTALNKSKVTQDEKRHKSFGESIMESLEGKEEDLKNYLGNKKAGYQINMKAVGTMGVTTNAVAPQFAPIVGPAHEMVHARNFIPVSPTISNLIRYVQFTTKDGLIAPVVGYGTTKPQIDYNEIVVDAPVIKIAGFINVADEFLEDIVGASSFLSAELPMALYDAEDLEVFKGSGATGHLTGLWTQASTLTFPYATVTDDSNDIDKLAAAMAFVRRRKRVVTAAWVSPEDYLAILINKADGSGQSGEYTYPVRFNSTNNMLMIGDMPVIQHTVFEPGQGFVGDFARGARIFQKADASLVFSTENNDNFQRNITTVRVEERIALADYYPESFVKVSLNATYS